MKVIEELQDLALQENRMEDVTIKIKDTVLGPLTVSDLKVLRIAIVNAIEVSGSSSDIKTLKRIYNFIETKIEEATTAGR